MKAYIKEFIENVFLENGIPVMIPADENQNYGFFFVGTKMFYFQEDCFEGQICFSSQHKPSKGCGTGFGIQDRYNGLNVNEITIEYIRTLPEVLNKIWGRFQDRPSGYYTSFEEYMKANSILKYKVLEAK